MDVEANLLQQERYDAQALRPLRVQNHVPRPFAQLRLRNRRCPFCHSAHLSQPRPTQTQMSRISQPRPRRVGNTGRGTRQTCPGCCTIPVTRTALPPAAHTPQKMKPRTALKLNTRGKSWWRSGGLNRLSGTVAVFDLLTEERESAAFNDDEIKHRRCNFP